MEGQAVMDYIDSDAVIRFDGKNNIYFNGNIQDVTSNTKMSTVFQQAPFIRPANLRLILPRVRIFLSGDGRINLTTHGFGDGWTEIERPVEHENQRIGDLSADGFINIFKRSIELQTMDNTPNQLLRNATLYKEKAKVFSALGICPPVGDILKIKNLELVTDFFPTLSFFNFSESGNLIMETIIQLTRKFIVEVGYIYAVEVADAEKLEPGTWEIIRQDAARNPHIDKYDDMDIHSTNIINGYYVDWELYGWDMSRIKG